MKVLIPSARARCMNWPVSLAATTATASPRRCSSSAIRKASSSVPQITTWPSRRSRAGARTGACVRVFTAIRRHDLGPNREAQALKSRPSMELLGKVALITGGASGIGRAFARALAREGADVVVADLDVKRLEQARAELAEMYTRGRLATLRVDVRKDDLVRAMAADALAEMGHVDVLVNAAGVLLAGELEHVSSRDWTWMLQTNLLGSVRACTELADHMAERGSGQIVNVVSFGGLVPRGADSIAYDPGEAAIAAFTQGLA